MSWALRDRAPWDRLMASCRGLGRLGWWKRFGLLWRLGGSEELIRLFECALPEIIQGISAGIFVVSITLCFAEVGSQPIKTLFFVYILFNAAAYLANKVNMPILGLGCIGFIPAALCYDRFGP